MKNNAKTSQENVKTAYPTLETLADNIAIIHYELFCQQPEKDYDSDAAINTVSRSDMPHNVAGFYRPDMENSVDCVIFYSNSPDRGLELNVT